jgi:hypothetical protein
VVFVVENSEFAAVFVVRNSEFIVVSVVGNSQPPDLDPEIPNAKTETL